MLKLIWMFAFTKKKKNWSSDKTTAEKINKFIIKIKSDFLLEKIKRREGMYLIKHITKYVMKIQFANIVFRTSLQLNKKY